MQDTFVGADLIVHNARITTQNLAQPEAAALAVKRGRIYAVGSDAEILALKGQGTKVIDAGGLRLIPGLEDAHLHLLNSKFYNYETRWDGVPTLTRALEMLHEQAERTPEGQWVRVSGGWSPHQFEEDRLPTMEELERAVPNRPLHVQYAYNQAFMNAQAMEQLGVGTSAFPDLPGMVFEKDQDGRYTGVLYGNTFTFITVETMLPAPGFEEQVNSLGQAIRDLNRFGVTSVIDCASSEPYPEGHNIVGALIKDDLLRVRLPFIDIQIAITSSGFEINVDDAIETITKKAPISPGQNLHPRWLHGHEYEGYGEALGPELHDHEDFDQPAIIIDPELMRSKVEEDFAKLVKRRIPFRVHLSYNENITPFLDALEKVNQQAPLDGLRWSIEHAETISPENIARVRKLGGAVALDGKMAVHGDSFVKTYSREKALQTPPFRLLLQSGIPVALTTDGYRASSYHPWTAISWAVTGKSVSGSEVLGSDNRLSRAEALKLFTLGAAWFDNSEHEKGRIAPGNLADFAVLNADYFSVPDDEIRGISSVLTVVDGRVVFGEGEYRDLAPELPEVMPAWSPVKYFGGYYDAS
ncbi:amidohydrolase [Streptomyces scopuliridis]|uniref:amidohydrolase n=1 Tax=Streptomyces scopuliridis TaxID=452529 RepID=UPI0036847132